MKRHGADRLIGAIADLQHGLITSGQTQECGLSEKQKEARLASGRLVKVDRNVYRLNGAPVTWNQRVLAACLASDGVGSHRTASMLRGLGLWPGEIVELTIAPNRHYRNETVQVHRSVDDPHLDARYVEGIPVTSVRRTLLDLGAVVPPERLEKAVERAPFRGLTNPGALWAYIDEVGRQGRPGVQALRAVLEQRGRVAPTESDLETEMVQLLRRAGLPDPVRQLEVVVASRRFRLDLAYPDLKIALEVDGDSTHFGATVVDNDHTRDALLQLDYWLTLHFTKRHIRHDAQASANRVRTAIRQRSLGAPPPYRGENAKKIS
jgi:very-short-patch-repair endonuclease